MLSMCRCCLPLVSTRGDQASRVSAPFSRERTVCPSTKTTSPCGRALDAELAALLLRLCSSSLTDGPWFQAGLGLCWGRALPKGKVMWAIATRAQARGTKGGMILQNSTPWLLWLP